MSWIEQRERAVEERIRQMRDLDEWNLFQRFVISLLPHDGYRDVRHNASRADFGRDGAARLPDGRSCFIAVSFGCSLTKIKSDARRWGEDENREPAEVMLFLTWDPIDEVTLSRWRRELRRVAGLELRLLHKFTLLKTATRDGVLERDRGKAGLEVCNAASAAIGI